MKYIYIYFKKIPCIISLRLISDSTTTSLGRRDSIFLDARPPSLDSVGGAGSLSSKLARMGADRAVATASASVAAALEDQEQPTTSSSSVVKSPSPVKFTSRRPDQVGFLFFFFSWG